MGHIVHLSKNDPIDFHLTQVVLQGQKQCKMVVV